MFASYTAHRNSCTQLIPKSICRFMKSYWFIQSGRDAALTVLSVALSSALKLWSWHCDGIVPPRHDQKTNHLLYAVNDEIAAHFLPVKQDYVLFCPGENHMLVACYTQLCDARLYLSFFMMLDEFFGWETMKVAEFWFDHDRHITQRLFDDSFGNAINRPTHVCLWEKKRKNPDGC